MCKFPSSFCLNGLLTHLAKSAQNSRDISLQRWQESQESLDCCGKKDPSWRLWVLMSRLKQIVFLGQSNFSYENLWNMFFTCAVPRSWYSILTGEKAAKTSVIGQVGPSRLRLLRNNMALQHLVKKLGCLKGFQIQAQMSSVRWQSIMKCPRKQLVHNLQSWTATWNWISWDLFCRFVPVTRFVGYWSGINGAWRYWEKGLAAGAEEHVVADCICLYPSLHVEFSHGRTSHERHESQNHRSTVEN